MRVMNTLLVESGAYSIAHGRGSFEQRIAGLFGDAR
jgi:hypothetical protein